MFHKDVFIPLVPFVIEVVTNVVLLPRTHWWLYVDPTTLILILCIWAFLLISNRSVEPPIPTDGSVKDELERLKKSFSWLVILGFIIFGMYKLALALSRNFSSPDIVTFYENKVLFSLFVASMFYVLVFLLTTLWNLSDIKRVVSER